MLELVNLKVHFKTETGVVRAVDNASFEVLEGERFVLIGESGSGKSVLAQAILRLLPKNAEIGGQVIFGGRNLMELSEEEMRKIRGREIAWIPQSQTALNPVMNVGFQCAEPLMEHFGMGKSSALARIIRLFDFLGIGRRADEYPHQFSGGMRQRVLVAMGISADPKLIIADEPTKGLDVMKREQVVGLFRKVDRTMLIITHDLQFAERLADRVAVMYCGEIVEISPAKDFFSKPLHPYSRGLLDSLPSRGLKPIPGFQPSLMNPPAGCRFGERCPHFSERCRQKPPLFSVNGRLVRCWLYERPSEMYDRG